MDRRRPKKPRTAFKKRRNVGFPKDRPVSTEGTSTPSRPSLENPTSSASKAKLGDIDENYDDCIGLGPKNENIIIDLRLLNVALSQSVACAKCQSTGIVIRLNSNVGLSSKLEIYCENCSYCHPFYTSEKLKDKNLFEVNVRLVYGFRSIGKGCEAAKNLCGVMNLPSPPTRFSPYVELLGNAAEDVCFKSMKDAVEEAVIANEGVRDLSVAIDGTWQKRGHTSLNGVVTATSFDTGKVVDVSIMSKHCVCPNKLGQQHLTTCIANYKGGSGGMEVQGAIEIFQNSLPAYNVRYTKYLGDGDSKGYQAVQELNPYGDDTPVTKLESGFLHTWKTGKSGKSQGK